MRWVSERRFLHFIEDIKNIFARKDEVPKKLSQLENDIGGMFEEKDPTVPSWAKNPTKPKYTANEVGALPDTTKIPSKTSDLQNDSGFLTEHQDLSGYALKSEVPKSASDVGADASGTAVTKVSEHNAASNAHNDIRLLVQGLAKRLNALADSDDTTLDQMSEVVAYIKSNKSLIDAITASKVSVTDIIDNLTTNVPNKPLSAAQGVALKALIDGITTVELDETLTDHTKAAPADVVGELKSDIDEVIDTGFEVVSSYNRVNPDKIKVGKYVYNVNGELLSNPSYNTTDFIPIEKDHIYAFAGSGDRWAVYNTDKTFVSRPTYSLINNFIVFTASEDGYIRYSYKYNDNRHAFVELNKDTDANVIDYFVNASIFYDNKIIQKEIKEDFAIYLYNLMDASKIKVGYYGDTVNTNYDTTGWMELPSEPLTIYDKSLKPVTARGVWYADRDFTQIDYRELTNEILAETPTFAKAKYFRYSVRSGLLENTMVFPSSIVPFKFFEYGDRCLRKEYISPYISASDAKVEALKGTNGLKMSADMLTSNTSLEINDFPSYLKKGIAITADMEFSAFCKVSIGKGYESYRGDWLELDDTNVIYKHYEQSTSTVSTVAHGLTINDSLSIALYIDNDGVCNVSLATNGGSAEFSIQWAYEQNGKPFVIGDQEMTEVNLSAIALDAKCPIWLFGDSYFGVSENRVIGQLKNLGYTDGVLVDGMAGIGTSSMLDDLQKLIALGGSPKIVICCEGMNDGGSGYASNITAIIGMCDGVGAELVLYKVPVVAKRITENTAVNTAMLATGKRYIDAYKAVGATDDGTWWDGYLNSDGVHPNEIGAKAIAQRILIDVPEIMQYGRKV